MWQLQVISGENVLDCGTIYLTKEILEEIKELMGEEIVSFEWQIFPKHLHFWKIYVNINIVLFKLLKKEWKKWVQKQNKKLEYFLC